jgi:hypothetical protein
VLTRARNAGVGGANVGIDAISLHVAAVFDLYVAAGVVDAAIGRTAVVVLTVGRRDATPGAPGVHTRVGFARVDRTQILIVTVVDVLAGAAFCREPDDARFGLLLLLGARGRDAGGCEHDAERSETSTYGLRY